MVSDRGAKRDGADAVVSSFFEDLDVLEIGTQIVEDNRVFIQGVSRGEKDSSLAQTSVGHGLNHDVGICGMVEVSMREDDGLQLCGLEFSLGSLDEGARTGI
jgi:hypothetical protein